MPLIYGKGEENAFKRLKASIQMVKQDQECIQHLSPTDPRNGKKRIQETKGSLLEDSYRCILEHSDFKQWRRVAVYKIRVHSRHTMALSEIAFWDCHRQGGALQV
ncbi:hypothetical protein K432DRAFT_410246 [Lepidopterella palustris CBS 459.81]|uniref:Uncharacterized protein n=1 Tax=Lepidopterella palustris CBS 459.81 TaxID=1314670 RepID=A0A8E2J986_9PEZI|nr:hypothetical protein K432DRAFT_410246 [Lepidopterella palustris CBS 459.81]